jgi:hypothetical protein
MTSASLATDATRAADNLVLNCDVLKLRLVTQRRRPHRRRQRRRLRRQAAHRGRERISRLPRVEQRGRSRLLPERRNGDDRRERSNRRKGCRRLAPRSRLHRNSVAVIGQVRHPETEAWARSRFFGASHLQALKNWRSMQLVSGVARKARTASILRPRESSPSSPCRVWARRCARERTDHGRVS